MTTKRRWQWQFGCQFLLLFISEIPVQITLKFNQLECGPMPNLMVALPNIGGALCSTPQSLADAHY